MAVRVIPARRDLSHAAKIIPLGTQLRVGAYCRVSTDYEEQESSYESQVNHYRELIESHPGWVLVDIYADEGLSGTSAARRDNFQRMIRDCEDGKLDLILTKSISRFARNTLDCLHYIRKLKGFGIPIEFEKEGINTLDEKGELLISVMASIAQQESQSISQNVRLGIQYNFQRGKPKLNYTCFLGYTKKPNGDKLLIVPEEADIVRRIFRDFLEGMTFPEIAGALQRDRIKTPGGKGKWYPSTVESMIQNEKYQGDLLLQKTYTVDFLTKERANNHGQAPQYLVENAHEPIVPREVFMIAQGEVLRRQAAKIGGTKSEYATNMYALSSIAKCGECGAPYRRNVRGKARVEWRCRTRVVENGCDAKIIKEKDLHAAVIEAINRLPEKWEELVRTEERIRAGDIAMIMRDMAEVEQRQRDIEERIETISSEIQERPSEDDLKAIQTMKNEMDSLHIHFDELLTKRAELGIKMAQTRAALELVDAVCGRVTFDMTVAQRSGEGKTAACYDADDFFRRTVKPLPVGSITRFDDDLVRRFIERVTIYEERVVVRFKVGVEIEVPISKPGAALRSA